MIIQPLTGRIRPIVFHAAPTEGGGAPPAATPPAGEKSAPAAKSEVPRLGGAFSAMLEEMRADGDAPTGGDDVPAKPEKPAAETPKPGEKPKVETPPAEKPVKPASPFDIPPEVLKKPETPAKPAEGEKPPETPAAPDFEEATKGMSDKARENFKRQRDTYESQLAEVRKELDAAKKSGGADPKIELELKQLREANTEMMGTLEKIGVERSPAFTKKFVAARNDLVAQATETVVELGGDAGKFKKALAIADRRERSEAIEAVLGDDVTDLDKATVGGIVNQILRLDKEKDQFLADAKNRLAEDEQQQQQKAREESEKVLAARKSRFIEVTSELASEHMLLRTLPADHASAAVWNGQQQEILQGAQDFLFTAESFDDFAKAAVRAQMATRLEGVATHQQGIIAELQKQIEDMSGAAPGVKSGGGGKPPVVEEKGNSFSKRVLTIMHDDDSNT